MKRFHSHRLGVLATAAILLVFIIALSLSVGSVQVSLGKIVGILFGKKGEGLPVQIVRNIRLPRTLVGLLVGMNLAVSGILLQGIIRNPMASPNIIGVNAGAGLAAVVVMALFPSRIGFIPPASFIGALGAALTISALANSKGGKRSTVYIVLAGVAVSNLLNAGTSALMVVYSDILEVSYSWLLGSLSGRSWSSFALIWPYSLAGLVLALFLSPKINLFALGDDVASSVGLPVRLYRFIALLLAAVLAGSAVSVTGTIGFVGLIAPHAARLLVGNDHRYTLPLSALLGAILLILSDTLARTLFSPVELSVGIITSLLGAPFFLFLLFRKRKASVL